MYFKKALAPRQRRLQVGQFLMGLTKTSLLL